MKPYFNLHNNTSFSRVLSCILLATNICTCVGQEVWETNVENTIIFSSPRLHELTGDSILDVVVGDGIEDSIRGNIRAFNGLDGEPLWSVEVDGDIFSSALFYDVNNDHVDDIIMGGRDRQLHAVNGTTGDLIWTFDTTQNSPTGIGWMQFYNTELVPDQDSDGLMDIVLTNGGNPNAMAGQGPRFPGWLLLVSSQDGTLLNHAMVPDSAETYSSLVVADLENDGTIDIVFGTGGETYPGGLWRTTLDDLLINDLSNAIAFVQNQVHGFVAAPVLADINRDNILDVIAADAEGRISVFNGQTNQLMWDFQLPITECYSTPAIGQFTGSDDLDVYANIGKGVWPFFDKYYQVMIDGQTGIPVYLDSIGHQFSSPLSYDFDNDGFDEAILSSNATSIFQPNTYSLFLIDFNDQTMSTIHQQTNSVSGASTPWIGDLDGNSVMDIVLAVNTDASMFNYSLKRLSTSFNMVEPMLWGSYHGSNYNGVYGFLENTPITVSENSSGEDLLAVSPNPSTGIFEIVHPAGLKQVSIFDATGQMVFESSGASTYLTVDLRHLAKGVYFLSLVDESITVSHQKIVFQ